MHTPRLYQEKCLQKIKEYYDTRRISRILVSMPTGTGKSFIFGALKSYLGLTKKILIVAHRKELLDQAKAHMQAHNPEAKISLDKATTYSDLDSDIVVGSVQTLGLSTNERLDRLDPDLFDALIIDECHHSTGDSYEKILRHFNLSKRMENISPDLNVSGQSKKLLLGLTATPNRSDNVGLSNVFDSIVFDYSIREAIQDGWLVDLSGIKITTKIGLDKVSSRAGDFAINELSNVVNIKERNKLVVQSWLQHAQQRQTVVFCVDVQHAKSLADEFKLSGVKTEAVWDSDPDRSSKLLLHKNKQLQVITNVGILTEGYDDHTISCILMARPTKSTLLFTQMIGRGLRLEQNTGNLHEAIKSNPNVKKDCLIIDVVDNTTKHSVITLPTLFGLPPLLDLKEKSLTATLKTVDDFKLKHPTANLSHLTSINNIEHYATPINLLQTASDINDVSKLTWYKIDGYTHLLVVSNNQWCKITQNLLNNYTITGVLNGVESLKETVESQQEAFNYAESWINVHLERWKINLLKRNTKWRKDTATPKQIGLIRKILKDKTPPDIDHYTKGDAANLITGLFAKKYV